MRASISGESVAIGRWRRPSRRRSQWISSAMIPDVAPRAGGGHALKLVALEDAPDGIVRVAEQERARARAERVREGVEIHRVPAAGAGRERVLLAREAVVAGGAQDRRIDRRLHEQALAGRGERAQREVEAGDHSRQRHHRVRAHAPAVALGHPLGHDLVQLGLLHEVAEEALLDARAQRLHDGRRRGEVHVGDPERQDVGRELAPLVAVGRAAIDDAVEVEAHVSASSWLRLAELPLTQHSLAATVSGPAAQ